MHRTGLQRNDGPVRQGKLVTRESSKLAMRKSKLNTAIHKIIMRKWSRAYHGGIRAVVGLCGRCGEGQAATSFAGNAAYNQHATSSDDKALHAISAGVQDVQRD